MRKNIFYAAILLLAGVVMAACSGDDDLTSDSQTPTEGNVVVLKGTIGSKGSVTRAVDEYNGSAEWKEGNQFAIYYETSNGGNATAIATVNDVHADQIGGVWYSYAEFTATLISPQTGENYVNLVYPASAHDGQGDFKRNFLMTQDGTLEYINAHGLDIQTASSTMNVDGTNATLTDNVLMEPQVCLCHFYLQDNSNNDLLATKLEISDGTNNYNYTITPDIPRNDVFVALLPAANFTFTATSVNGSKRVYTKQEGVTLENCTDDNVGDVFDKDGNIYKVTGGLYSKTYSGINLNAGTIYSKANLKLPLIPSDQITPVAMIAYVGASGSADASSPTSTYRGLAMAMEHATSSNQIAWSIYTYANDLCDLHYFDNPYTEFTYYRNFGDMKGISNTEILAGGCGSLNHEHPAAQAAKDYSVEGFTPNAIGCSNWFLPSSGQVFRFLKACRVGGENWNKWTVWPDGEEGNGSPGGVADSKLVMNILLNAGLNGVNVGSDYNASINMWTSTQCSATEVISMYCLISGTDGIGMSLTQKSATAPVFPFLAF